MTASINLNDYLVNDIELLTELRKDLGLKSWDQMAVLIDLSSSNLYDHVYSSKTENGKPVYEKILQLWHIKLFTALNYLNQQNDPVTVDLLEQIMRPLSIPKHVPNSVTITEDDLFENGEFGGKIIKTPEDLKALAKIISKGTGLKDPVIKRGPGNGKKPDVPIEEQFLLTNLMAKISGISFRTYNSYAKASMTNPKAKRLKGMLSKIYTLASLLAEEKRFDIIHMMADIDKSHTKEYGIKRVR